MGSSRTIDIPAVIDRRTVILGAATLAAVRTAESVTPEKTETQMNTPTERVLGIGGIFFRSRDPKSLAQWYQLHLGIDPVPTEYGHPVWQQAAGPTVFGPFPMDTGLRCRTARSRCVTWSAHLRHECAGDCLGLTLSRADTRASTRGR